MYLSLMAARPFDSALTSVEPIETDIVSLNAKGTLTFNKGGSGVSSLGNFLQNQLGPSGSKNLDNASEIFATGANPNTSYQADLGPNGFAQEWGPSAYDHRYFVSVAYVWAPAGFSSGNSFANAALGVLTRHWTNLRSRTVSNGKLQHHADYRLRYEW
jgi:hypothetical protein